MNMLETKRLIFRNQTGHNLNLLYIQYSNPNVKKYGYQESITLPETKQELNRIKEVKTGADPELFAKAKASI